MSKLVDEEALKAFRERLDERYVIEGEYSDKTRVGFSDYADNLTPYSADSGVYQSIPFNFQGTGCGNGETQVDTGSFAYLREKRGNGIVYNQLFNFNYSNNTFGVKFQSNHLEIDAGSRVIAIVNSSSIGTTIPNGHKCLCIAVCKSGQTDKAITIGMQNGGWQGSVDLPANTNLASKTYARIFTLTSNATKQVLFINNDTYDISAKIDAYVYYIDLTKWFNGNIPQYLLDHPESFFRYYTGALTYNTGEVRFSNARYLDTYSRNQWDEEVKLGQFLADTGAYVTYGNCCCSKNKIRVIPNTRYYFRLPSGYNYGSGFFVYYYDKNNNYLGRMAGYTNSARIFTTPANCIYINIQLNSNYGTTYNNDITISIYYDGESGYDKHYPFERLQTIDTGTEQLYSAGLAYDRKEPSGLITRNIGSVDLGTLNWYYAPSSQFFYNDGARTLLGAKGAENNQAANLMCSLYRRSSVAVGAGFSEMCIGLNNSTTTNPNRLAIKNSNYTDAATFKAAMSGVILYYELATPTTEQGTPFTENVKIDDFGSMSFESANGVPQGNMIFYPVDYKAFVDTLVNYTDGDATSLAKKSDIIQELPDVPSTDGTYVLKTTVSSGTVSYAWVEEGV